MKRFIEGEDRRRSVGREARCRAPVLGSARSPGVYVLVSCCNEKEKRPGFPKDGVGRPGCDVMLSGDRPASGSNNKTKSAGDTFCVFYSHYLYDEVNTIQLIS